MNKEPENTNKELLKLKQELKELNCRISTQQEHIQKLCSEVEEREKELRFHHIAEKIINNAALSPEKIFQKIVDLLPEAFQFPEITGISLKINGWTFNSKEFIDSNIFIEANIQIENSLIGFIKASYNDDGKQKVSKKFLKEEKNLLKILSKRLSEYYVKYLNDLELKKNEDKYQSLVDNINDVIYEITADGTLKYINNAAYLISGYHPNELIGKSFFEKIFPNDLPLVFKALSELGNEKYIHVEFRFLAKDCSIKWVRSSTKPIMENRIAIGGRGVLIDIHETKTAQILLAQNEKKLQFKTRLQELLVDISNKYINLPLNQLDFKINKSLADLGQFIGADRFYIFDYDFDQQTCSNTYEWCAEGIEAQIDELQNVPFEYFPEWLNAHCKGETFYIEDVLALDPEDNLRTILEPQGIKSLVTVPIMDGEKCLGFTGFDAVNDYHIYSSDEVELLKVFAQMLVNIKNRLKSQKEIEDSNQKTNVLLNNLSGVIYHSDFDGKNWNLSFINDAVFELTGYKASDYINNAKIEYNDLIHEEDLLWVMEEVQKAHKLKISHNIEYRIYTSEGEQKWVWEKGHGVFDGDKLIGLEGFISDITEKKHIEEELLKSEEELNQAQEIAKMGSWFMCLHTNEITLSQNYYKLVEREEKDTKSKEDLLFPLIHKNDVHLIENKLVEIAVAKSQGTQELRLIMPDGRIKWVQSTILPVYHNDVLVAYKGVKIDITEKKLQEEEIRLNNAKLNAILDAMPDMIFTSDSDGNYLEFFASNLNKKINDYSHLIGQNIRDAFPEETATLHLEKIKACLQTKKMISYEYPKVEDGKTRYFDGRIVFMDDNKVLRFVRDISNRKEQENEIKKLTIAIEQSPIAMVITNIDSSIQYVSPAFQKITGYSKEEVIGKKTSLLKSGKTSTATYQNLWTTISAGEIWKGEWVNKKKNGDLYWESISITPIKDENKLITGYLAIKEDITKRKNAAKEIIDLNENLEVKIDERTFELKQTNNKLQQEIEQRKQIEEALSKSEYNYRSVIENVNEVIFQIDKNGSWIFLNKSWETITGFTIEESLGQLFINYVHPDDRQLSMDFFTPLINREKDYCRHQIRYLTKDGGFRWIEVFARLGLNANNEITETFGTLNDITERKKAEDELEIEKQRLASIIEGTNVGTWEWNIKTGETKFNERWASILGYSLEEILPISIETWIKFAHPEDLHKSNELLQMHFQGTIGYYSFESRMKHRNGSWVWVLDRGKVNKWDHDGKPLVMSGTHQDITEQKEAEEELNWNKTLLELMSNSSPFGFLVVDNTTDDILYINKRFCQIWEIEHIQDQMERGELKNNDIIPYCIPVLADVPAFAESCKPLQNEDNRMVLEDEISFTNNRTIRRFTTQIRGTNDEYFGRFYIFEDITEEKRISEEVIKAKNEAMRANKAKSTFLANMSHEIRTPMNAVLGYADILNSLITDKTKKEYIESIKSSGKSLLTIINDVLDLAKIEAGKIELEFDYIKTASFFSEFKNIFAPKLRENGIDFMMEIAEEMPDGLYVDETRLRQVLLNLIGNAVKFTPKGFIKVSVTFENPQTVTYSKDKSEAFMDLIIEVEDTGIGISAELQDKIFEEFVQAEGRNIQGTGLGLAISKRFINLMNGTLSVTSKINKGSVFKIKIPDVAYLNSFNKKLPNYFINPENILFEKATILVVDDIEINRRYIKDVFKNSKINIIEASNGKKGLEKAEKMMPDLIISDIRMPEMDGFEFLDLIKKNENLQHIPVIAYSASVMKEQKKRIYESGFVSLLTKPVLLDELINEIGKYLPYQLKQSKLQDKIESKENITDLEGLIQTFENEFTTKWMALKKRQPIGEIKEFSKNIIATGKLHNANFIISYGEEMLNAAENFNIDKVLTLLKDYPKLIINLNNLWKPS
ncbi:MAG: PAS domain S-box protein [Lutibacter sp.]|nr:PAS domain S-box protein [Lutibacter sp.]